MVQLPETLSDFAVNSDSWFALQIEMYLKIVGQARGTHAGALLSGGVGLLNNPFLSEDQKRNFRATIVKLTEVNNG